MFQLSILFFVLLPQLGRGIQLVFPFLGCFSGGHHLGRHILLTQIHVNVDVLSLSGRLAWLLKKAGLGVCEGVRAFRIEGGAEFVVAPV